MLDLKVTNMYLIRQLRTHNVFVFGAGYRGNCVCKQLRGLDVSVKGFIDNNPDKRGQHIQGVRVFGLEEIADKDNSMIIISPYSKDGIVNQLESFGLINWIDADEVLFYTPVIDKQSDFQNAFPFNHYESPYADMALVHEKESRVFDKNITVLDIDFNLNRQQELLSLMEGLSTVRWTLEKSPENRYYYKNEMFGKGSADVLCYMMQIIKPKRIIEVGSGYSTAAMLDTNNCFFDNSIEIICIEPRADRLRSVLRNDDNIIIHEVDVQDIELEIFNTLDDSDILFIDSSHVARPAGDVNHIIFEILPRLKKGVYIHFHDIFWPFVYPKEWVYEGRAYNEMYVLRAFLMNNPDYMMQFFGEMIKNTKTDWSDDKLSDIDGSIWIRKE